MNRSTLAYLSSEASQIEQLLPSLPAESIFEKRSLESRLAEIKNEIEHFGTMDSEPAKVRLTFNGKPILGSHGIFADFAMRAVGQFSDTVSTLAASIEGPLGAAGPIPNRELYQLLITNTALGSFGFDMEEHSNQQLTPGEKSKVELAIGFTEKFLVDTKGSDEELADALTDIDPRVLDKIRSFLRTLSEAEAICSVAVENRAFRFADVNEVKKSLERISQENIHIEHKSVQGELQGVLPTKRTFELRIGQNVISGKVGPAIDDADKLNELLHKPIQVPLLQRRIGDGRPRYQIEGWPTEIV